MATISKALARGPFTTTIQDVYTVPTSSTTTIVTNILIVNTSASSATFELDIDDVELFLDTPISGNTTISLELKQVIDASATPKKMRGAASSVDVVYHISGVEIS
jgi:hypothetical protein